MASLTGFAGTLPNAARLPGPPLRALALGAAWLALAAATYALPEEGDFPYTATFAAGRSPSVLPWRRSPPSGPVSAGPGPRSRTGRRG